MVGTPASGSSSQSRVRTVGRIMCLLLSALLAVMVILGCVLIAWSPGKAEPILNEDGQPVAGSLSEKIHVNINGLQQGMFIKSKNPANPVLLFLHGGPGMPEYFLTQGYPTGLEDHVTMVWWEQRGSGLSFRDDLPPETMTLEQFISDTLEVSHYLRKRFGKEKIYLMGHSGGSVLGIQAAARAPDLYHAYIGVAQIAYQPESEKIAYDYMLSRYQELGNEKMVRKLEAAVPTATGPLPVSYLRSVVRDEAMHDLGIGTTHDMRSLLKGIVVPTLQCRAYTLGEKVNLLRGKAFTRRSDFNLFDHAMTADIRELVPTLNIPVYFVHGIHDYTVNYTLAKRYLDQLQAPLKGFYTFEQSAHSPLFEEPGRMQRILREDVLMGANRLADTK